MANAGSPSLLHEVRERDVAGGDRHSGGEDGVERPGVVGEVGAEQESWREGKRRRPGHQRWSDRRGGKRGEWRGARRSRSSLESGARQRARRRPGRSCTGSPSPADRGPRRRCWRCCSQPNRAGPGDPAEDEHVDVGVEVEQQPAAHALDAESPESSGELRFAR